MIILNKGFQFHRSDRTSILVSIKDMQKIKNKIKQIKSYHDLSYQLSLLNIVKVNINNSVFSSLS